MPCHGLDSGSICAVDINALMSLPPESVNGFVAMLLPISSVHDGLTAASLVDEIDFTQMTLHPVLCSSAESISMIDRDGERCNLFLLCTICSFLIRCAILSGMSAV